MRLDGKQVVIIGGSSGIGLETARLALTEGAFVTIAGRSEDRLRKAAKGLGSDRMRSVVADLADESSIRSLFADESRIDHIFVPAGELRPGGGDLLKGDINGLRSILEVRLLGVAYVVRHARPRMEGGSITLMSGLYSTRPAAGGAIAAAAVAAVEGMTRALALDLAPIRVNAVAPGHTETEGIHRIGLVGSEHAQQMVAATPLGGRFGQPEDIAPVVVFLASDDAAWVTGERISASGGLH